MTARRRFFPWLIVGAVFLVLTWIALGHTGPASESARFSLIPFSEYGWALACVFSTCDPAARSHAWLFLLINGLGNVVVFIPLGLALYIALRYSAQSPRKRLLSVMWSGVGVSLFYELAQLWIPGRIVASDDILTNGCGALLGGWLALLLLRKIPETSLQ